MTREEIEKAIENGKSVWVVDEPNNIEKVKPISIEKSANRDVLYLKYKYYTSKYYDIDEFYYGDFEYFFKSKAEAEHYLHHANISRTEHLPFLTWEEFEERKSLYFTDKQGKEYTLTRGVRWNNNESGTEYYLKINNLTDFKLVKSYGYSEAYFYRAYDECVELFGGKAND